MFYAPDAEVLLDDAFAAHYCFRLRAPAASRPRQVGLGFVPARRALRMDNGVDWQVVSEARRTGADGYIRSCLEMDRGDEVEIRIWAGNSPPIIERHRVNRRPTSITIEVPGH